MPHVVMIEREDHCEVVADYSGSPRHVTMTEVEWQEEYTLSPCYKSMRESMPGSAALIAPRGCGKWKKDWSARFVPPAAPDPAPTP